MLNQLCRATLALTLAAGMSCCLVAAVPAQSLKKMTLVQMHPNMGIGEEVFLYAVPKRLGYFAAEGLDVDIQNSQTGMISAQVLQSNNAQVGTTAAAAIMTVREQNGDSGLVLQSQAQRRDLPGRPEGLADPEARRPQRQERRRALVWRRRRIGLEAELERNRHHARSVHRHCDRRRAFGDRGAAQRPDRCPGDVGCNARRSREHGTGGAPVNIPLEDGRSGQRSRPRRRSPTRIPKKLRATAAP